MQIAQQAVTDTLAQATDTSTVLTLWQLILKGGWVMAIQGLLTLLGIYLFVERWLVIRSASKIDYTFMANIRDLVHSGNIDGAHTLCKNSTHPIAKMIEKALARIHSPTPNIEVAVENAGRLEIARLERNLAGLATISGVAPMLGFLGTVTGMIRAFYNVAQAGYAVNPSMLASGIYEALITTAAGLLVGILAYIGYNYLVTKVEHVIYMMESAAIEFMDLLEEQKQKKQGA